MKLPNHVIKGISKLDDFPYVNHLDETDAAVSELFKYETCLGHVFDLGKEESFDMSFIHNHGVSSSGALKFTGGYTLFLSNAQFFKQPEKYDLYKFMHFASSGIIVYPNDDSHIFFWNRFATLSRDIRLMLAEYFLPWNEFILFDIDPIEDFVCSECGSKVHYFGDRFVCSGAELHSRLLNQTKVDLKLEESSIVYLGK